MAVHLIFYRMLIVGLLFSGPACAGEQASNGRGVSQKPQPKNVIIMIADGGGFNHYKSGDYYRCGRSPCQDYEIFPVRLAMSTYPDGGSYDVNLAWADFDYVNNGATDSAAAATAMARASKPTMPLLVLMLIKIRF